MRALLAPLAVAVVVTAPQPAQAANAADEAAIQSVFLAFRDSWNAPGMPGFEKLFAPDADFVVITGKWLRGRDEIVSYHRDLLKTYYGGSKLFVDRVTVRFVGQRRPWRTCRRAPIMSRMASRNEEPRSPPQPCGRSTGCG